MILLTNVTWVTNPWFGQWTRLLADNDARLRKLDRNAVREVDPFEAAVYLQWPERCLFYDTKRQAANHALRLIALLGLARARGLPVLLTAHNVRSHAGRFALLEGLLWKALGLLVTDVHHFSRQSQAQFLAGHRRLRHARHHVARHGDYAFLDAVGASGSDLPGVRPDALHFGRLQAYKGTIDLIRSWNSPELAARRLLIAGVPASADDERQIREAASGAANVELVLERVSEERLEGFLRAVHTVILPYQRVLNSGSLLRSLTTGRRVILPASATAVLADHEPGAGWVWTYEGPLRADLIAAVLDAPAPLGRPDLSPHSWGKLEEPVRGILKALSTAPRRPALRRGRQPLSSQA